MLKNVEAWVCSQDKEGAEQQRQRIETLCGVKAYALHMYMHEPIMINTAIRQCQSKYFWYVEQDVDLLHPETAQIMVEWLEQHPDVGLIRPNREGEPTSMGAVPRDHYIDDGTAWLYRVEVGAFWDEELPFSAWGDLDFGEEVVYKGSRAQLDPRIAVWKHPTRYSEWTSFRKAYVARNRLHLEAKWYWIGRDKWQGIDHYNATCDPARRIPTIYELNWWSEGRLQRFASSVDLEHPQIYLQGGYGTGNENWRLPD